MQLGDKMNNITVVFQEGDNMPDNKKVRFINDDYFRDSPEGPEVVGSKCRLCGKVFFPQKKLCTSCFKEQMEVVPLSKKGKICTYSVAERSHIGLDTPFITAYIALPEKVVLFSVVTGCEDNEELRSGLEMEMIIEKLRTDEFGYDVLTYKYKPVG